MQSTLKIIVIVLVVLVAAGIGGIWYFLQPHTPATNTQNPTGGLPTIPGTNGDTAGQTQDPNAGSAGLNFEQSYNDLFKKLTAQKITFANVSAESTGNVSKIYSLYKDDVAESKKLFPAATDFSIMVAASDLNGDGTAEVLVYENLLGFCGSGGCPLDILQLKNSEWIKVSNLVGGEIVGLANTSTNGYKDLFLSMRGDTGSESTIVRYSWDGSTYRQGATVAAWNGAAFNLVQ